MSGMQMPPTGGGPPQGGEPPRGGSDPGNPIERNQSVFNPTDMAGMISNGQVQKGMSVKDLIENVFKVPIDAPAQALVAAVKRHAQTKDMGGKVRAMSQQRQGAAGPPPQRPGASRPPQGAPPQRGSSQPQGKQSLADLMNN